LEEKLAAEKSVTEKQQVKKPSIVTTVKEDTSEEYVGHIVTISFTLRALNKNGNPKTKGGDTEEFSILANNKKISLIEDTGDGTYSFDYNCLPGENNLDVCLHGKSIPGFPLNIRRKTEEEIAEEITRKVMEEQMKEEMERHREDEERRKLEEEMERAMKEELLQQEDQKNRKNSNLQL